MKNIGGVASEKHYRPLSELNLMDNFLFQTIVSQGEDGEEFCRIILSTILGKTIRKVRVVPQQSILGTDTDRHGIRMDAYVEDVSDECKLLGCSMADAEILPDIYDIEPNNDYEKDSLPKRMRYYQSLIDSKNLEVGLAYSKMPKVVVIVILPYDPFGKNRMVYTIKNQCIEDNEVMYEDCAAKIFLYTKGKEGNPSQALVDMLKYMENTTAENITNEDIHLIHKFVEKAKHRKEVGINYMKMWEEKYLMRKEALAEGREEGLEIGRAEGLEIGRAEGLEIGRAEGRVEGIRPLVVMCKKFNQSVEETMEILIEEFLVSKEEAQELIQKYWVD